MYNNLLLYRNELKIKSIPKYKFVGIVAELLYSRKIFSHNPDIISFLKEVFAIEYRDYVFKSRTLIVAKTCRYIEETDNISTFQKSLYKFVCNELLKFQDDDNTKRNNTFDGWLD